METGRKKRETTDHEVVPLVGGDVLKRGAGDESDALDSSEEETNEGGSEVWNGRIHRPTEKPLMKRLRFLTLALLGVSVIVICFVNLFQAHGFSKWFSILFILIGFIDIFLSIQLFASDQIDRWYSKLSSKLLHFFTARRISFYCLFIILLSIVTRFSIESKILDPLLVLHAIPTLALI